MCGRTACTLAPPEVRQACSRQPRGDSDGKYQLPKWRDHPGGTKYAYKPRFNTGPSTFVPIMVSGSHVGGEKEERVIQPMLWGMVPRWHKDENFRSHNLTTINCRWETLLQKPLFSVPLKCSRRGVLICDGFYEWKRNDGSKQPYYFYFQQPKEGMVPGDPEWKKMVEKAWDPETGWHGPKVLTVAVVFDIWAPPKENEDHPKIYSFSTVTVPAHKTIDFVHDRMPAILDGDEAIDKWLDPDVKAEDAVKELKPFPALAYHKVPSICNNVNNDSVACVRPLSDKTMKIGNQSTLFQFFKKKPGEPVKREAEDKVKTEYESPEKKLKKE